MADHVGSEHGALAEKLGVHTDAIQLVLHVVERVGRLSRPR